MVISRFDAMDQMVTTLRQSSFVDLLISGHTALQYKIQAIAKFQSSIQQAIPIDSSLHRQ